MIYNIHMIYTFITITKRVNFVLRAYYDGTIYCIFVTKTTARKYSPRTL